MPEKVDHIFIWVEAININMEMTCIAINYYLQAAIPESTCQRSKVPRPIARNIRMESIKNSIPEV
ncbi:hypothetical protein BH20ACI3_BH20ACI3_23940 [soil metagenome]